ncbi:hypothetical protein, partial [Mycobacterium sp.]|uniref:hypothetical protein n=1 Tax=Mycobacterium sp. TaxID=1785 RepID=UPI003C7245B1
MNPKKPKNFPALAFLILCGLFMRHSPTKATWGDPPLPVERKGKKPQECAQDHNPDGPGEESDIAHRIHHPGLLQFDQGYANNGPVTADVRSHTSAHKSRSQIA